MLSRNAKAWVGLIGSLATAAVATFPPDGDVYRWLTLVAALATAAVVYVVPNAPAAKD
jgi:predicted DNA-binding protein with PD1-like motif